jgi:hypothetical protein
MASTTNKTTLQVLDKRGRKEQESMNLQEGNILEVNPTGKAKAPLPGQSDEQQRSLNSKTAPAITEIFLHKAKAYQCLANMAATKYNGLSPNPKPCCSSDVHRLFCKGFTCKKQVSGLC